MSLTPLETKPSDKHAAPRNVFKNHRTGEYCIRVLRGVGKTKAEYISLKTTDRAEAMRRLARTGVGDIVEIADDERFRSRVVEVLTSADRMPLSQVVDEFLADKAAKVSPASMIHPRTICGQFMDLFPSKTAITDPTAEQANLWINTAPSLPRRQRRMSVLADLFQFAFDRGHRKDNLGTRFGLNTRDLTFDQMEREVEAPFTREEFDKFMACPEVQGFWRWSIQFSWWLGLRMADCARMQWGSFCSSPGKLVVWQQKTRKRVELDLSDPLLGGGVLNTVVEEMKKEVQDAVYCFPEQRDLVERQRQAFVRNFRDLSIKAGLDGRKTWKCFRSAAAQRWQAEGRSLDEIGEMLGHVGTGNVAFYLETKRP